MSTDKMSNLERFKQVVGECYKTSDEVLANVRQLRSNFESENIEKREGITLFELKNSELLAYIAEITNLMLMMSNGQSIVDSESLERLVYLRTVLERIRPIEQKLKHQVDKLLQYKSGNPSNKKRAPRPEDMGVDSDSDDEGEDDGDGTSKSADKTYIPPKLVAVPYDGDEDERTDKTMERARRRALSSSLVQELRQQYSQAPEELREPPQIQRKRTLDDLHRTDYEEDMMVRLQVSKDQKNANKRSDMTATLDSLLDFGEYMAIDDGEQSRMLSKSKKYKAHKHSNAKVRKNSGKTRSKRGRRK